MNYSSNYHQAINLIKEAALEDPKKKTEKITEGLEYSERMATEIGILEDTIEEHIDIAARCQHLYRWEILRDTYPQNNTGYHQWRRFLYKYQSDKTSELLKNAGYNENFIEKCCRLIRKEDLGKDSETQTIEDAACLVFVKYYLSSFLKLHSKEKLIEILRKTKRKMSDKAVNILLKSELDKEVAELLKDI